MRDKSEVVHRVWCVILSIVSLQVTFRTRIYHCNVNSQVRKIQNKNWLSFCKLIENEAGRTWANSGSLEDKRSIQTLKRKICHRRLKSLKALLESSYNVNQDFILKSPEGKKIKLNWISCSKESCRNGQRLLRPINVVDIVDSLQTYFLTSSYKDNYGTMNIWYHHLFLTLMTVATNS